MSWMREVGVRCRNQGCSKPGRRWRARCAIGGLTSTTDGRVWATDRAIARVVAITVP